MRIDSRPGKLQSLLVGASAVTLGWATQASTADAALPTAIPGDATTNATTAVPADAGSAGSEPSNTELNDIVVTAQRRQESLQKVPIAAIAETGAQLTRRNVRDLTDLSIISPSLKIDTPYGNTAPKITLRGVGSGSFNLNTETTVALYLDEFVLNPVSAKLGQLFDIDRVEVLRGPQGTLYGKNSTGGAINYITNRPDGTTEADLAATVARFGEYDITGGVQAPITDDLSARVSFNRRYREGYQYNSFLHTRVKDHDDWGGRIGLRYKTEAIDAYLKVFADRSHTDGYLIPTYGVNADGSSTATGVNPLTGLTPTGNIDDIGSDVKPRGDVDNVGATLNLDVDLGGVKLSSISGYLHSVNHIFADQDGSPASVAIADFNLNADEVSQELRLSSNTTSAFNWIAGASFFHQDEKLNDSFILPLLGLPPIVLITHEKTTSFAGFIDATYHFNRQFSLVGGIRLTTDKKDFHHQSPFSLIGPFDVTEAKRWTRPTYRAGINFQIDPSTLLYASYNHGYRSGAFDIGFPSTTEQFKPANPEYVDSFEGGVKATLFDRHLRIAADVFYQKFKDQQLLIQRSDPGSICCSLVNAGKSKIYGFEFDGSAKLADNFDVNFQGSVLRSKYIDFRSGPINYSGQTLANIPSYQFRIQPELKVNYGAGHFFISPDLQFTGREHVSTTSDPFGRDTQNKYVLLNGQVGYQFDNSRYGAFLWIRNATNKRYKTDAAQFAVFGLNQVLYAEPRTYGLTVTGHF